MRHNTYFRDFPANVPDTEAFWAQCLQEAVAVGAPVQAGIAVTPGGRAWFFLNLLSLPSYGTYQHTYEDMLAAHEELIPAVSDRVTILHLGGTLDEEAHALYLRLAGSAVPLSADDTAALRLLADHCIGMEQPADVPVRESRAVINAVRVKAGVPVLVTTVTDVLRLACELSDGDAGLQQATRFRSFRRRERVLLMEGLEAAVGGDHAKLADVNQHAEQWKRLGERIVGLLEAAAPDVSGRVLLSVREHLQNRAGASVAARVFANRRGRALAVPDLRGRLDAGALAELLAVSDAEIARRLPEAHIIADPAILGAALPLSAKPLPAGLGIFPRGSVTPVEGGLLRFFIHWQQKSRRTDYDLSALFLDEQYGSPRQVSWTRLRGDSDGAVHSGDITDAPAPNGASEFIDIGLEKVPRGFIVPQVYIYSGEGFHEAAEAFFGFMTREGEQQGQPFEARTVRMKSALYGESRIAVPLVFTRGEDGRWYAKWLHLYLRGHGNVRWGGPTNQVEGGHVTASLLARSVVERDYLRVGYLLDRWAGKGCAISFGLDPEGGPVTYIGLEQPEELPEGSEVFTLDRLGDLIPA